MWETRRSIKAEDNRQAGAADLVPAITSSIFLTGVVIVTPRNYTTPSSDTFTFIFPTALEWRTQHNHIPFTEREADAFAQGHRGTQRLGEMVTLEPISRWLTHWLQENKFNTLGSETHGWNIHLVSHTVLCKIPVKMSQTTRSRWQEGLPFPSYFQIFTPGGEGGLSFVKQHMCITEKESILTRERFVFQMMVYPKEPQILPERCLILSQKGT